MGANLFSLLAGCLYKGVYIDSDSEQLDRIDNCTPEQCMAACRPGGTVPECDFFRHHDNADAYYDYYYYGAAPREYCEFFKRAPGGSEEHRREDPEVSTGFPSPCGDGDEED